MAERKILVSIGDADKQYCNGCPMLRFEDPNEMKYPEFYCSILFDGRRNWIPIMLKEVKRKGALRSKECIAAERAAGGRGE
jgi:hypothetical protein